MLDALANPNHHNHAHATEWAEDYDPNTVDELPIKYALSRIANRRNAAKARLAKNIQTKHDKQPDRHHRGAHRRVTTNPRLTLKLARLLEADSCTSLAMCR